MSPVFPAHLFTFFGCKAAKSDQAGLVWVQKDTSTTSQFPETVLLWSSSSSRSVGFGCVRHDGVPNDPA